MAVKIIGDLSLQRTGHIKVILGGAYVTPPTPTPTPTITKTPTQTITPTTTSFDCYIYQLTTGPNPIGSTGYSFICCKSGLLIVGALGAGDSLQPCARNNSVSAGPAVTVVKSIACSSDNIGSCVEPSPTPTNTTTPTQTPTQTPTSTIASCNISKSGSYSGNDYHQYPDQSLSDSMTEYITFTWDSVDRPNRFTVYENGGFVRFTSGWVGTANYPGPWGASLSTPQSGFANICFQNLTGRYVKVEAGNASPTTPISDAYSWSITCGGICPSSTPTPTQTPTNTKTPTQTPTNTPTVTNTPSPTNGIKCNEPTQFNGGLSYPSQTIVTLGSSTGTVTLSYDARDVPDRYIVLYDNVVVIDTGYRGSANFNIGGANRDIFNTACLGRIDPTSGLAYPNAGATDVAADGYPIVRSPGLGNQSFSKNTSTPTTATVRVYAPVEGTVWFYTLNCPASNDT